MIDPVRPLIRQSLMTFVSKRIRPAASLRIAVLLAAVLLTSAAAATARKLPEAATTPAQPPSVKVTVEPVTFRQVQRYVGVVGTLHGYEEMTLGAKVGGRVQQDHARRVRSHSTRTTCCWKSIRPTISSTCGRPRRRCRSSWPSLGWPNANGTQTDVTHIPTVVQAQLRRDNAQTRLERAKTLAAKARRAGGRSHREACPSSASPRPSTTIRCCWPRPAWRPIQVKQEALAIAEQQLQGHRGARAGAQSSAARRRQGRVLCDYQPHGLRRQLCDGRRRAVQAGDRAAAEVPRPRARAQERRSRAGPEGGRVHVGLSSNRFPAR